MGINIIKNISTEIKYFWITFKEHYHEWIFTIFLGLSSGVVALFIIPKEMITFYENYNERYPYVGETIGSLFVGVFIIVMPCIIFVLLAVFKSRKMELSLTLLGFFQIIFLTLLITEILKLSVARPRPNYYSYCGYDLEKHQCLGKPSHVRDAKLSFPSGHSSNSFSSATFLVLLLSDLFPGCEIWWILLKLIPIYIAIWIGATRIIDHMHHVSDVIAGAFLGTGIALMIYSSQKNRMLTPMRVPEEDELPLDPTESPH